MAGFATYDEIRQDTRTRMDKTMDSLKKDFSGLRTGRASTALLDGIMVEAYGAMTPLAQVGTVSVPESRMLSVQVWDRSLVKAVEKAIRSSELGLNPMNDGQLIRIPIPPLNEERRIELTKVAAKYTEQARVAVRNIRRDAMDAVKKMQKDGDISEDEQKKYETEIQNLTDTTIKAMDEMLKAKEQEIIDFAELWDFLDMPIKNYSSGMAARLGFAVATMVQPDILICDEVLSVGDYKFQEKCEKRMKHMLETGTTLLYVSHSITSVQNLCDHALWLDKGHVKMCGDADTICDAYMNF